MAVQFIIGRAGSGKTHHCFHCIVSALQDQPLGPPILWILPRQATFTAERNLACASSLPGFLRARVTSFDSLCADLLQECGGVAIPEITRLGRQMVLGHLLRKLAPNLRFFDKAARQPGLAGKLEHALAELDRAGKDPAHLAALLQELPTDPQDPDPLSAKLHDLHLLYTEYTAYLGQDRLDPRRRMDQVLKCIATSTVLRNSIIYVDEFSKLDDFERRILARLAQAARRLEITLLFDPDSPILLSPNTPPQDLSLFHPAEQTYCRLRQAFADESVAVDPPLFFQTIHRFQTPALCTIERNLFTDPPTAADTLPENLDLVEAPDRRAEVNDAARTIRHHLSQGLRFRDIAVLVRNLDIYHDLISAAFREHDIPYFVDRRRSMAHHPLLQFLRAALAIPHHDWPHDSVMLLIKSGLASLSTDQADRLENYVLEHRLRGSIWQRPEPWSFHRHLSTSPDDDATVAPDESAPIDGLRARLRDNLAAFLAIFPTPDTALPLRQVVVELFQLFTRFAVPETLSQWITSTRETLNHEQAAEHEQAWNDLVDLFDQLVDLLGPEPVTFADFTEILESGLETFDLALTPPTTDQVLVGQIDRTRTPNVKAVLLLGLNEGLFPNSPRETSILSDSDRFELERRNFTLDPPTERILLDENLIAYIAFTRSSHHLYVSRSISDDAGRPLGPSPYWRRLRQLFPTLPVRCLPRDERTDPSLISTPRQLLTALMRWVRLDPPASSDGPFPSLYQFLAAYPTNSDPIDTLRYRAWKSLTYDNRAALCPQTAKQLFANPLAATVSQIETFATCPFRHFARYALHLQPRDESDTFSINLDNVFHRILEDLVREMLRRRTDWPTLRADQSEPLVRSYAAEVATTLRGEMMLSNPRSRYLLSRIERSLEQIIASQQAVAQRRLLQTTFPKTDFGPDAKLLPPLSITTPNNNEILLAGRIDRIDILENQSAAAIIDYRLSKSDLNLTRVYHGLSLQLLASLLVLQAHGHKLAGQPLTPVAAFYVRLLRELERVDHPSDAPDPSDPKFAIGDKQRGILNTDYFEFIDSTPDCTNSDIVAARKKKDGSFGYKNFTDIAAPDEFSALLTHTRHCIARLADQLLSGHIDSTPYRINTLTPCPSCDYKSLCRFDPAINHYNHIPSTPRDQILQQVLQECENAQ
ncbi:MAG: exodeoxyribonuclease V subunit gamma [Planctomycetota bacterium]|nr:exodeoxyribonuclease V subunit gamma [Planctomycetota bacterium]